MRNLLLETVTLMKVRKGGGEAGEHMHYTIGR